MEVNAKDGFFEVNQNEWISIKNGKLYRLQFTHGADRGSNMFGQLFEVQSNILEIEIQKFFKETITCEYWVKEHYGCGVELLREHRRKNFLIQAKQYIEVSDNEQ